jgi:hypothetical protein
MRYVALDALVLQITMVLTTALTPLVLYSVA